MAKPQVHLEELAAKTKVLERGAMMQLKSWSLKRRTGQPVQPDEVSASSIVTRARAHVYGPEGGAGEWRVPAYQRRYAPSSPRTS